MIVALALLMAGQGTTAADAAKPSHFDAMATCRAKYGMGVTSVTITKNGRVICREGPGPNATRQEVYDYCRKRSGATPRFASCRAANGNASIMAPFRSAGFLQYFRVA
jgi:hypothetical protein